MAALGHKQPLSSLAAQGLLTANSGHGKPRHEAEVYGESDGWAGIDFR
jgi:hypothetical protein